MELSSLSLQSLAGHFWNQSILNIYIFDYLSPLYANCIPGLVTEASGWAGAYSDLRWVQRLIKCFAHHRHLKCYVFDIELHVFPLQLILPSPFSVLLIVSPSPDDPISNSHSSLTPFTSYFLLPNARIISFQNSFSIQLFFLILLLWYFRLSSLCCRIISILISGHCCQNCLLLHFAIPLLIS